MMKNNTDCKRWGLGNRKCNTKPLPLYPPPTPHLLVCSYSSVYELAHSMPYGVDCGGITVTL